MNPELFFQRVAGCLLAGAAGDALGAPVEFMDRDAIVARFGKGGIRDYAQAYGGTGKITDNTQMTLFTAEACLEMFGANQPLAPGEPKARMRAAYQRWYLTQTSHSVPANASGLLAHADLFNRRAPGTTCLNALRVPGGENNDSKGCGGIMRVAPCGIVYTGNPEAAFKLGKMAARLTHGHPSGYLAAGVFAAIIALVMTGESLPGGIEASRRLLLSEPGSGETLAALDHATRLAAGNRPALACIGDLGEGWVAEEALAISVYCALKAATLEEGVVMAVNITGDSDSTGAMTGNLLGAMHGLGSVPARWLDGLELRGCIEEMARQLAQLPESGKAFTPNRTATSGVQGGVNA